MKMQPPSPVFLPGHSTLKRILEIKGKNLIKEVWPNLELYIHGGVSLFHTGNNSIRSSAARSTTREIYNAKEVYCRAGEPGDDDALYGTWYLL